MPLARFRKQSHIAHARRGPRHGSPGRSAVVDSRSGDGLTGLAGCGLGQRSGPLRVALLPGTARGGACRRRRSRPRRADRGGGPGGAGPSVEGDRGAHRGPLRPGPTGASRHEPRHGGDEGARPARARRGAARGHPGGARHQRPQGARGHHAVRELRGRAILGSGLPGRRGRADRVRERRRIEDARVHERRAAGDGRLRAGRGHAQGRVAGDLEGAQGAREADVRDAPPGQGTAP